MRVEATELEGVFVVEPRRFGDARGYFVESFNRTSFAERGLEADFMQDNLAFSADADVLRGLHFQKPPFAQTKLVRCLAGRILDVVVELRRDKPAFGRSVAVELSEENGRMIWAPKGVAHGYLTLEPGCLVGYKVDAPYAPEAEGGIFWRDPALGIDWRLNGREPILSAKDAALPNLAESPAIF